MLIAAGTAALRWRHPSAAPKYSGVMERYRERMGLDWSRHQALSLSISQLLGVGASQRTLLQGRCSQVLLWLKAMLGQGTRVCQMEGVLPCKGGSAVWLTHWDYLLWPPLDVKGIGGNMSTLNIFVRMGNAGWEAKSFQCLYDFKYKRQVYPLLLMTHASFSVPICQSSEKASSHFHVPALFYRSVCSALFPLWLVLVVPTPGPLGSARYHCRWDVLGEQNPPMDLLPWTDLSLVTLQGQKVARQWVWEFRVVPASMKWAEPLVSEKSSSHVSCYTQNKQQTCWLSCSTPFTSLLHS